MEDLVETVKEELRKSFFCIKIQKGRELKDPERTKGMSDIHS